MAKPLFLGILLGLIGFALVLHAAGGDAGGSIQDLLRANGLPAGLLPSAVKSYEFDRETGFLEVHLNNPCLAKYDGFVFFNQTVRGNLSYGSLRGLVGFSQEELFLWLPVKEILVADPSSGVIYFDIGVAHKQLSLSLFENPPDCSAGKEDQRRGEIQMIRGDRNAGKIRNGESNDRKDGEALYFESISQSSGGENASDGTLLVSFKVIWTPKKEKQKLSILLLNLSLMPPVIKASSSCPR